MAGKSRAVTRKLMRIAVAASTWRSISMGTLTTDTAKTVQASTITTTAYALTCSALSWAATLPQTVLPMSGATPPPLTNRNRADTANQPIASSNSRAEKPSSPRRATARPRRESWNVMVSPWSRRRDNSHTPAVTTGPTSKKPTMAEARKTGWCE